MMDTEQQESRINSLLSVAELLELTMADLKTALLQFREEYAYLRQENTELKRQLFIVNESSIQQQPRESGSTFLGKSVE